MLRLVLVLAIATLAFGEKIEKPIQIENEPVEKPILIENEPVEKPTQVENEPIEDPIEIEAVPLDSGALMTPVEVDDDNVVIFADEKYAELACPQHHILMKNAVCESDDECGEGTCYRETKDKAPKARKGLCCTGADYLPKVTAYCPKDLYPATRYACGIAMGMCPEDSQCYYAKDYFGRCCSEKEQIPISLGPQFYYYWPYSSRSSARASSSSSRYGSSASASAYASSRG